MFTYWHLKDTNWKKPLGVAMTIITLPFTILVDLFPFVAISEIIVGVGCLWEEFNKK